MIPCNHQAASEAGECQNSRYIVPILEKLLYLLISQFIQIQQNIRVFVGVTPGEDFKILDWNDARAKKVRDVKVHPMWKGQIGKEPLKDIALIKLHRKYYVEFTEEIRPVCLPSSSEHFKVKNKFAYAAGWGHTEEDQ